MAFKLGISPAMIVVCLTAAANCATIGYDQSMMSSLNILKAFQRKFVLSTDEKGLLTASQNLGGILMCFFAGHFVDRFGRKKGIFFSACLAIVASIIQSTSTTKGQFFVGRIFVGLSKSLDIVAVPSYLVEIAPPKRRGLVAGLYWACWLLGAIVSSAVGYGARSIGGDWSWRTICICMCGPAGSVIALLPFIPESPRWLISKDREVEGLQILAKYHGGGNTEDPLVVAEFREIKETIAYEQSNRYETYAAWWRDFSGNIGNRRRGYTLVCLGVFEQTVGSSIISFFLSSVLTQAGITSESKQFGINLGQNVVAFAAALTGIFFLDKVGRVPMLVAGSTFCAGVLAVMCGLTSQSPNLTSAAQNGVIAMVFMFQIGYSSTWTPISFSYCAEVLNFTIRAKGMAFYSVITSLAGFVNQYLIPVLIKEITWKFYITGVVWNIFMAIVIYFTFIETNNLTLEQIDKVFNGVPRSEIVDVVEAYNGGKPINDDEIIEGEPKNGETIHVLPGKGDDKV